MKILTQAEFNSLQFEDKADYKEIYTYKTFGGKYINCTEQEDTIEKFIAKYPNCKLKTGYVLNRYYVEGSLNIYKADKLIIVCHDKKLIPILIEVLNSTL